MNRSEFLRMWLNGWRPVVTFPYLGITVWKTEV